MSVTKKVIKRVKTRLDGQDVLFSLDTQCDSLIRIKIVINDIIESVLVKFITEYNQPLSETPSMHLPHSSVYRLNAVCQLVRIFNSEGTGSSNIARVRNAVGGWLEENTTTHQCDKIFRSEWRNNMGKECFGIVKDSK